MYPLRVSLAPLHSSALRLHTFLTGVAKFPRRCPAARWLAAGNNNKSRRRLNAPSRWFPAQPPALLWEVAPALFFFFFFYFHR